MIERATVADFSEVARLVELLWPGHDPADFREMLSVGDTAVFLARADGRAVGFAQCGLRHDYVEGTDERPVGYLEGVYVEEAYRRRGFAAALVSCCEDWARARGCAEFASDCELENGASLAFHLGIGFREANRIICFVKRLEDKEWTD